MVQATLTAPITEFIKYKINNRDLKTSSLFMVRRKIEMFKEDSMAFGLEEWWDLSNIAHQLTSLYQQQCRHYIF
jgi:hypothetical protein